MNMPICTDDALLDFLGKLGEQLPPRRYIRPNDISVVIGPNGIPMVMHTEVIEDINNNKEKT